jgi:hypothetical protein
VYEKILAERSKGEGGPYDCERSSRRSRQPQASGLHCTLSHLRSLCSRPITPPLGTTAECHTPFRISVHFIVIAVMSGTFPDTYRVST